MGAGRRDLAWLGGLGVVLLVVMLWPYVVDGYRFGVGPDVPVYLWWTRVGASEGLSMVGSRPGAPALAAALAGTLSLSAAAVTAGLASALGVAIGAAAAALVRAAGGRIGGSWLLAGLLAGVFSVHLVAGYLANLVLAATFLAAAACLAGRTEGVVGSGAAPRGRRPGASAVPRARDRRVARRRRARVAGGRPRRGQGHRSVRRGRRPRRGRGRARHDRRPRSDRRPRPRRMATSAGRDSTVS